MSLELSVWREACRHLEIEESVARIFPTLAAALPVGAVIVRRLDAARMRLETVAAAPGDVVAIGGASRIELGAASLAALGQRAAAGALWHGEAGTATDDALAQVVPEGVLGDVLAGALVEDTTVLGALVLVARAGTRFSAADVAAARGLVEPFTVALANDARVHELARLREAVEAENRALLSRLGRQSIVESIVGENAGLRLVMERVQQVANTDVPVLVLGETGSGKEVIARALHERSRRARGPIVRVNCGAIPTELVDSELFGHERGSFTGAAFARKGWFERADGGTLFLDEVGELPLAAQVRLLRILQDGTLERVGGQRTVSVDVRIVAATHRDLHAMVEQGTFREDLWYRMSVFPMRLPALRERLEDIPALAAHFAARAGERLGAGALTPTSDDLALLLAYPWPGNVRELASVIERAAILGHGRRLEVAAALGADGRRSGAPRPPPSSPPPPLAPRGFAPVPAPFERSAPFAEPDAPATGNDVARLDAAMVRHIEAALARTGGRIEGPRGAAALLGINPHTLRARMRKLGIAWARFRDPDAGR
jgi:transcriptional regulator with GAF, ATPase, and Fis domain